MLTQNYAYAGRPGRLTHLAQGDTGTPRVSGDGKVVVWNQVTDKGAEIMRYQDGKIEQLTDNALGDIHAYPSHDGSTIVWDRFSREDVNDKEGRWQVVRWQDGQETILTENTGNCQNPSVSADGKVATWLNDIKGDYKDSVAQIWRDGKIKNLSDPTEYAYVPSLNSDGSRVAFRKDARSGPDIFVADGDSPARPLTRTPFEQEDSVHLTSDGNTVFFSSVGIDGTDNLYKIDVASGKRSTVSARFQVDETWLGASADGKIVAWTDFDRTGTDVEVQIKRQEAGAGTETLTDGKKFHAHPHVSADGNSIVFMEVNPENTKDTGIYLWQADS